MRQLIRAAEMKGAIVRLEAWHSLGGSLVECIFYVFPLLKWHSHSYRS